MPNGLSKVLGNDSDKYERKSETNVLFPALFTVNRIPYPYKIQTLSPMIIVIFGAATSLCCTPGIVAVGSCKRSTLAFSMMDMGVSDMISLDLDWIPRLLWPWTKRSFLSISGGIRRLHSSSSRL